MEKAGGRRAEKAAWQRLHWESSGGESDAAAIPCAWLRDGLAPVLAGNPRGTFYSAPPSFVAAPRSDRDTPKDRACGSLVLWRVQKGNSHRISRLSASECAPKGTRPSSLPFDPERAAALSPTVWGEDHVQFAANVSLLLRLLRNRRLVEADWPPRSPVRCGRPHRLHQLQLCVTLQRAREPHIAEQRATTRNRDLPRGPGHECKPALGYL